MKILCVSDEIDPLVYSAAIKERFSDVALILCAGDLPLDYLDFIASSLNKPLLHVYGNHHAPDRERAVFLEPQELDPEPDAAPVAGHVGSRVCVEEGLIVAGLGGSMRYNAGPNQFTEFDMWLEIFKLIPRLLLNRLFRGRFLDVLLTHAPPCGIHDRRDLCHRGFKAFLWFMRRFQPRYLVHGHIHLYDQGEARRTRWLGTDVINAFGHYIIDIEADNEADEREGKNARKRRRRNTF
ncbi:MAG: metallophosphoesterase [Treponema sp.]|nr:metallophosphoesterase [Treponema sp.]